MINAAGMAVFLQARLTSVRVVSGVAGDAKDTFVSF